MSAVKEGGGPTSATSPIVWRSSGWSGRHRMPASQTGLRVSTDSKPPGAGKPERRCCEVATGGAAIRDSHFEADVFRAPLP